jgi:4-alpha-glucanotransferase
LRAEMGEVPIIAEDLGIITEDVVALRERQGFPGMKVMQFALGADTLAEEYIPENYPVDCVAYTGTHDNDTVLGLFRSEAGEDTTRTPEMVAAERRTILGYTKTDGHELNWDFIHHVWQSKALLAICPLQDVLGLGSESRMNTPGQMGAFWAWRFEWHQLTHALEERLRRETEASGRCPAG